MVQTDARLISERSTVNEKIAEIVAIHERDRTAEMTKLITVIRG